MKFIDKLREFENQYIFMRWATGAEYGKLISVGEDFIEFNIIDADTMSYRETILIYAPLVLEVSVGGADIARIVAEVSSRMSIHDNN